MNREIFESFIKIKRNSYVLDNAFLIFFRYKKREKGEYKFWNF